ncbi:serine/threonine protein kinase [Streptomyces sp. SBST2-5]|uniref:non-specific serine/threonine protein kinase n=1 Tax=Streptomyces composti TaxID=2720025 RepID=A0ABX1A2J7_9ACTN|nr:serine/threonine protein kinase [Streptomyces composti]
MGTEGQSGNGRGTEGQSGSGSVPDNARVIAGRYRLEARLGRGGMGVVWRATDQLLGRRVAVKELPVDETLPAEDARRRRERTLREARALAQLQHPHIIVVHDVVEDDERPYIVLELIDGCSLADRIATRGAVDAQEAARIGIQLLGALRAAHAAGVLHRDLKPANVLLENGTDRVVLTDFGIAQVPGASTLTETGSFVGSPEYTAPERMSGTRAGPESDLWSLGALLCAALSGESPFRRDSISGVLHAVVVEEIRPPAQAEPILPVVLGLLERDPDRRLDADSAERMLRAFRETGRTPQVPPLGCPPDDRGRSRLRRPARREPGTGRPPETYGPSETYGPRETYGPPGPVQPDARPPTRSVLVAALAVAAMATAGVSAAALLMDRDDDGGTAPSSTAPETPASPSHSPPSTASRSPAVPRTTAGAGVTAGSGASSAPGSPSASRTSETPEDPGTARPSGTPSPSVSTP